MSRYILVHDIGTTGNKAALFDREGKLISSIYVPYETIYLKPTWVEQRPKDWWNAVCKSNRQLIEKLSISPKEVEVISFSGQTMGVVPVDKEGNSLRDSVLIWSDNRSKKQAEKILKKLGGWKNFYDITGQGEDPENFSISKMLWYKENEQELYNKTFKFLHSKDFIINKLTGKFSNDYSDASNGGYLDIRKREYSKSILKAADISKDKLPDLYESTDVIGKVTKKAAHETGLVEGIPVVEGAGDGSAATLGAGVIEEGLAYIYIGSANWTGVYSKEPIMDSETRVANLCHVIPGVYAPLHIAYTGGIAQQWFKDTFCDMEDFLAKNAHLNIYDVLNLKADKTKPGSGNLIFLPYLRGGGAPYYNPNSRGVLVGLNLSVKKEHVFRAVLEGVAINFRIMIEDFKRKNVKINKLRAIGGGALNKLWLQIFADVLNTNIVRSPYPQEACSLGAAVAGGIGVGLFKNVKVLVDFFGSEDEVIPNQPSVEVYNKLYPIFKKTYQSLTDVFDLLSKNEG